MLLTHRLDSSPLTLPECLSPEGSSIDLPQSSYRWHLWSSPISKLLPSSYPVLWDSIFEPPLGPRRKLLASPTWGRSLKSDVGCAIAHKDADKSSWVSSWARAYVPRVNMYRDRSLPNPADCRLCLPSLSCCNTWPLSVTPARGSGTPSGLR